MKKLYFVAILFFSFFVLVFAIFTSFTHAAGNTYYVSTTGNDSNPGTLALPWKTIQKAVDTLAAGDTVYVRGGQYAGIHIGWYFKNSGTSSSPITFSNYPGEQVVIRPYPDTDNSGRGFYCVIDPKYSWRTPKADYIHIMGTDVTPQILSDGVQSTKGIVFQGWPGNHGAGMLAASCDNWEVAGVDFVEMATGIYTYDINRQTLQDYSADNWYVHDNRVYDFEAEVGMQFNGSYNRIENNEIYRVNSVLYSPSNWGLTLLNFNGNHNIIKGNTLSRKGSTLVCGGILFEWDLADANTVEQNRIFDVTTGIDVGGGDNNVIRNNLIYRTDSIIQVDIPYLHWTTSNDGIDAAAAINIDSHDNSDGTNWPCNETVMDAAAIPANDPADVNYQYYYNPRNCHSYGNQVYNNTIHGFVRGIAFSGNAFSENTVIRNNVFSGSILKNFCWPDFIANTGNCLPLPTDKGFIAENNADTGPFGFVNINNYDFHLNANSPLIDKGTPISLVTNDFDGKSRPQGLTYDIGAYEYGGIYVSPTPTPTPSPTPTINRCDLNRDTFTDIRDFQLLANVILNIAPNTGIYDLNKDTRTDILDIQTLVNVILGRSACL